MEEVRPTATRAQYAGGGTGNRDRGSHSDKEPHNFSLDHVMCRATLDFCLSSVIGGSGI